MKISIAVCDDEQQQTEYIKSLVKKWADENNISITIDMFDSAENFKLAITDGNEYNVLLLDIQMGGQSYFCCFNKDCIFSRTILVSG